MDWVFSIIIGGKNVHCTMGCSDFDFFDKMKHADQEMDALYNSHNMFIKKVPNFFEPFWASLSSKLQKVLKTANRIF